MNVDLDDLDLFVPSVPHDVFDWLRENAPVSWNPQNLGTGFWNLVRHADVVHASRHHEVFSSAHGTNIEDPEFGADLMMINMDPPQHTRLRKLVSHGFHPKRIHKLEPHIRDIARRIVDNVASRGECDFVEEISAPLPLAVICEMIGVPPEDHRKIFDWSNTMIAMGGDPEYGGSLELATQAATEMFAYWDAMAAERAEHRRDDLASILLDGEVEGEKLSQTEFDVFLLLLAVAGNETTRNLISHGMNFLMENPEQRERLIGDMSLLPSAINEMLRMATPVMHFRRTLTRDTSIGGQELRAGEKVILWYIAANRDPEVFEDPHRFDVGRPECEHVTFGAGGAHFCLGFSLAELEIKIMFEELLARLPDMAMTGPPARLRSSFINGLKHLPVKFTPERL
ncbi:MAG TPA: cytochrome P450 [Actinomycetota bacterium]|nr:cytochrome P450 [Actinomycetota bacterium]